ncbi:hypothetical protein CSUI_009613 [Cystoisospora suis]|uniref:Uncharacterized protein n=1 Tax=Cystoisospora suis TaxID=483139 RepID=A0A2C6KJB1_9APIC|nr:hypothetical protein CSUI_009613 [Cystoisospora suis]
MSSQSDELGRCVRDAVMDEFSSNALVRHSALELA